MFRILFVLVVMYSSVANGGERDPLSLLGQWDAFIPAGGALESRVQDTGVTEVRLSGGSAILSKYEVSANGIALQWFPEVDVPDTLSVGILTDGTVVPGEYLYLRDGVHVVLGRGEMKAVVAYPDASRVDTVVKDSRLEIRPTDVSWYPVVLRVVLSTETSATVEVCIGDPMSPEDEFSIDTETHKIAGLSFDPSRLTGRRMVIGNSPAFHEENETRIPVSFVRKLQQLP